VRRALLDGAPTQETGDRAALSLDILAVEDNRVNQTVLRLMLEEHGCKVTLASNGNEALGKVKERGYDLIFMDLRMPGMDGLETTSRLRELERAQGRSASPIVALTAQALPEDRERCKQAGMDGFLSKPLVADELEALLQTFRRPA
jgi:CheY-like chemotaxis protein